MENNLPKGWVELTLKEVVDYKKGKKPKNLQPSEFQDSVPYLDIKTIEKGVVGQYADKATSNITNENEILVVWDGARSGWVGKAIYGAIGSTLMAIKPKEINKEYLFRYLQTQFEYVNSNPRGTGIPHVDPEIFWNIKVPIPPLEEQSRIVDKLETLLEKVATSKSRLEKIPVLLKNFRQSVLTAAVSGEITKQWRNEKVNTTSIPSTWKQMKATDACERIESGSTPKGKPFFKNEEIPYLKVYNIVNQKVSFNYKPQFIKREIHEKELKRCKVFPDDVIMNIVGPPLGKVALVTNQFPEWNINQAIVLFRPKEFLLPEFLYYVLCDGKEIKALENETRGSAGQSNISLTQCRVFRFPIPTIDEQKEIIRKVKELFHYADNIEARYQKAKAWFDKIPQAILAKAFRGELVPQDENDEPASVLLERIKKDKEIHVTKATRKNKAVKAQA